MAPLRYTLQRLSEKFDSWTKEWAARTRTNTIVLPCHPICGSRQRSLHFQPILMTEIVNFHISDLIHLGLGELVFYCTHAWSQYPEKGAVLFLHGLCRHDQMRVHIRGHVSNVRDKRTPCLLLDTG